MKKLLILEDVKALHSLPNLRLDLKKDTILKLEHGQHVKVPVQTPELSGTLFISATALLSDKRVQFLEQ